MARLSIEHLRKTYGDLTVVNDVNIDIADGEFLVLLGPSGCGKTTTLRMVAGFIAPSAGSITIGERGVTTLPPWKRNCGLVFQSYALFPHMTVAENVAYGLRQKQVPKSEISSRVAEALDMVKMTKLADRKPRQMSGGQQQRVAVARALAHAPRVLLLDEPFGALDAKIREELRRTIRRVQKELGITTILVTHDQEEAFAMGDRIGVMHLGRLLEAGRPTELYSRPATRFVATFLGAANLLPEGHGGGVLLLRPERLRLSATPPEAGERGLRARVRELAFQGATVEVRLCSDNGLSLIAIDTTAGLPEHLRVGEELWCRWNPADSHLLERPSP